MATFSRKATSSSSVSLLMSRLPLALNEQDDEESRQQKIEKMKETVQKVVRKKFVLPLLEMVWTGQSLSICPWRMLGECRMRRRSCSSSMAPPWCPPILCDVNAGSAFSRFHSLNGDRLLFQLSMEAEEKISKGRALLEKIVEEHKSEKEEPRELFSCLWSDDRLRNLCQRPH